MRILRPREFCNSKRFANLCSMTLNLAAFDAWHRLVPAHLETPNLESPKRLAAVKYSRDQLWTPDEFAAEYGISKPSPP